MKGVIFMNNIMKGIILIAVIFYIVSPVDAAPGPIDDIIVVVMALASQKRLNNN